MMTTNPQGLEVSLTPAPIPEGVNIDDLVKNPNSPFRT
jgi:hypothetical protein